MENVAVVPVVSLIDAVPSGVCVLVSKKDMFSPETVTDMVAVKFTDCPYVDGVGDEVKLKVGVGGGEGGELATCKVTY